MILQHACTVPGMSNLQTQWIRMSAPHNQLKRFTRLVKIQKTNEDDLDAVDVDDVIRCTRAPFIFWLLSSIGKSANSQLFYFTLVLRMRGLSRNGLDFARFSLNTTPLSVFDNQMAGLIARMSTQTR